ncbi:unnamed protein product, partial [Gulo gulo]
VPLWVGGGNRVSWSKGKASGERHREGQGCYGVIYPPGHVRPARCPSHYLCNQLMDLESPNPDLEITEEEGVYLPFHKPQKKLLTGKSLMGRSSESWKVPCLGRSMEWISPRKECTSSRVEMTIWSKCGIIMRVK